MMDVKLIDYMGSDVTVVNAARVSFNKNITWMNKGDEKLIKFLAENNHWTPFGHCTVQFRIKAPVFVARQLVKHQIGLTWNEVSRRYVDSEPEFYMPESWRANPENKKQGSSETETVDWLLVNEKTPKFAVEQYHKKSLGLYRELLNAGVCAEQARMVLPLSMMTEWYWTGSLYAFARVCNLRCAKDTQKETRDIADKISELIKPLFPHSWKHLITRGSVNDNITTAAA
jgi:thymidylate synthase (FAD)